MTGHSDLLSAAYNQSYDATKGDPQKGNLASYCQTDYSYLPGSVSGSTRMWLSQIKHTWHHYTPAHSTGMGYAAGAWDAPLVLLQNDYADYDKVGNRLSNRLRSQADGTDRTETYTYDNLYRLKTADYGDGLSQVYTFDPMGNRTKLDETTGSGTTSVSYNVDAANRLTNKYPTGSAHSTPNVVSDPNGNVLTDGARANTWDSENRLVSCVKGTKTSSFLYGANDETSKPD